MKKFKTIQTRAEKRKGGKAKLQALLPTVASKQKLSRKGAARYLAMMTKSINRAGFHWSVIEKKWPQFEEAFYSFNIKKLSALPPEKWEAYTSDARVVRNWPKIKAVMENVFFVQQESKAHGSFGKFMANWPAQDQIGLLAYLKKHGSRLGGNTGQWFLREIGKDSFILTPDVVLAIQDAGVDIADNPTSKRDLQKVQDTMNAWHEETGLHYSHLSCIAAFSVGTNYENQYIKEQIKKFSANKKYA